MTGEAISSRDLRPNVALETQTIGVALKFYPFLFHFLLTLTLLYFYLTFSRCI